MVYVYMAQADREPQYYMDLATSGYKWVVYDPQDDGGYIFVASDSITISDEGDDVAEICERSMYGEEGVYMLMDGTEIHLDCKPTIH